MKLLVNDIRIKLYCQLSTNSQKNKLETEIRNTQLNEIQDFLGKDLFFKLISDADNTNYPVTFTNPDYSTLFFGGNYTNNAGEEIIIRGLEEAISHYVYASVVKTDALHTPFGFKEKENSQYSTRAQQTERQTVVNDAINYALASLKDCEIVLKEKFNLMPGGCSCSGSEKITRKPTGTQFFKI